MQIGSEYGYYPNAPKTWLIVKEESFSQVIQVFQYSGVSITKEGKRHLEVAVGTDSFKTTYFQLLYGFAKYNASPILQLPSLMQHMPPSRMDWLANGHS